MKTHTTTSSHITNPPRQTEANAVGEIHGGHHQPPPNNTTIAQKCGATARNASQPARRATQEHAPHTTGKQNAGAPGGAPQQNPTPPKKAGGRKGLAPGLAPGPIPPAKRPHTTVWRQTRVRERSEVMTLHRRPVAALTNLSYTSKPQPVSNYTKCPRRDSNPRPIH